MVTHSYRGITLSSVIAKAFEIVILNRMSPVLDRLGFPDINQTAFQKGISCADAIFSTQEVLLHYIRQCRFEDLTCGRQSSAVLIRILETNCISLSTSFTKMGTASRRGVVCVCNT